MIDSYIEDILANQNKLLNINTYIEDDIKAIIKLIQDKIHILETYIVDGYHLSALFNKLYTLYSQDIINNNIANLAFKDKFLNEYNQMKSYDALVNNRIYYYLNHFLLYNKKYQDLIIDNTNALFNKFYIDELTRNNFSNDATTVYGRWCSLCGSRKLDIYDCIKNYTNTNYFGNNVNNNHLLVKNLYCELVNGILYITWQDVNIETYKYTLLFINNELIGQYKYNEHINSPVEVYVNKFSNINIYKICVINYDIFDEQIAQSLNQYVVNNNSYDHSNIRVNDLKIHQETILLPQDYFIKNKSDFYESEIIINPNNNIHTNDISILDKENIYIDALKNKHKKEIINNQSSIADITVSLDNLNDYYILDIFCFIENDILYIKWKDITTCYQSKLFLNSVLVGTYKYNEHSETPAEIDLKQLTKADTYTIYIANYNSDGKEITYKTIKYNKKTQVLNNNTDINMQVYVIDEDKNRYSLPHGLTKFNDEQLSAINQPTIINTQIIYTHTKPKSEICMNKSKYELDSITRGNNFYNSINDSLMQNILYQNNSIDLNLYKTKLEDNVINRQFNKYDCIYKPSFLHKNTSNWVRKNVLVIEYTARSKKNILKRSLRTFPRDIDFDFTCLPININNQLFQVVNDLDISTWYFKIFPISNYIQARLIDSNFTEYADNNYHIWQNVNMTSSKLVYQLRPLTFECIQLQCRNLSKRVELTWVDPYVNWKKTLIYIKEYDGLPIWRIVDATLIYESTQENQHEKIAYRLDNLENGKNYQIGIFPCTKDDVICLSPIQLIGQPRYIRPKQVINYDYVLRREEITAKKINLEKDIDINKNIHMTEGIINIGKFIWKNDRFSTQENTTLWFEALYPLLEGGELTFTIYNNKPCKIQVYINQLNVFNTIINRRHVYFSTNDKSFNKESNSTNNIDNIDNDNHINIKITPQHYSKIIIDVQSEYDDCIIDIKDIQLNYYTGEEKYNDLINN